MKDNHIDKKSQGYCQRPDQRKQRSEKMNERERRVSERCGKKSAGRELCMVQWWCSNSCEQTGRLLQMQLEGLNPDDPLRGYFPPVHALMHTFL